MMAVRKEPLTPTLSPFGRGEGAAAAALAAGFRARRAKRPEIFLPTPQTGNNVPILNKKQTAGLRAD